MILIKSFERTAKWDFSANAWWVGETTLFTWANMKKDPMSPTYNNISDALTWIIEHDQSRGEK